MKRIAYVASALVLVLGSAGVSAEGAAPRTESFLGIVKTVSGSSLTAERGTIIGTFTIEPRTHVGVRGATAKTKENIAAGKPGLTVPDVVHAGDQVTIKYREVNGRMVADDILVRTSAASARR